VKKTEHSHCLNCDRPLSGPFCAHCGQKDTQLNVNLSYFLKLAFKEVSGYDSRLNKTLKLIFTQPGNITKLHNSGMRSSFIPPVKLYLFISVILFVTLNLFEFTVTSYNSNLPKTHNEYTQPEVPLSFYFDTSSDDSDIYGEKMLYLYKANRMQDVNQGFVNGFSQAMFILLPLFALLLKFTFFEKKNKFVQHLIFSLHFHIFFFSTIFIALLGHQLYGSPIWQILAIVSYLVYLLLSLRKAYTVSFFRAALSCALIFVLHYASFFYAQEVIKSIIVMML